MILNTHLKNLQLKLSKKHKGFLGVNIARSFKTKNPGIELKKVKIKEDGESFEVYDYPKEFLNNENTLKLINKFVKFKSFKKKQTEEKQ
jgi:hypothetical protein